MSKKFERDLFLLFSLFWAWRFDQQRRDSAYRVDPNNSSNNAKTPSKTKKRNSRPASGPTDDSDQEEAEARLAYEQTIEALSLISAGMTKGKQELGTLALVSDNLNEGIFQASRLGEFSKTKNKIFKNN